MSFANPSAVQVGAKGEFYGWRVTVAARMVLGVVVEGETYYWNEYYLVGDTGNCGTLVHEETEQGVEWKLFREFVPTQTLTVAEASAKSVGDEINLDGTPTRVTLLGESRVYHLEGEPPEGVTVGDVARYLNADTGRRMLVASWTGNEIEFYEGEDVPETLVRKAFGVSEATSPPRLTGGTAAFTRSTEGAAPPRNYTTLAVIGVFGLAILIAIFWSSCGGGGSHRAKVVRTTGPTFRLATGASGRLGAEEFTISGSAMMEVARISGRHQRREYALTGRTSQAALLVQGLTGQPKEWHLLRPLPALGAMDPFAAAMYRRGSQVPLATNAAKVQEIFRTRTTDIEPGTTALPPHGEVRYGFLAKGGDVEVFARWDELNVQLHSAVSYAEADVLKAFQATRK